MNVRANALGAAALSTPAVALARWAFAAPALLTAAVLIGAAALQVLRQRHWRPSVTRSRPILWILHVSHA